MRFLCFVLILVISATASAQQSKSIMNSKHNLSASGPGAIRASSEQEVCIFCHAPHNASPILPAWNRDMPVSAYTVYASNSLDASPGQPTGSSKLCLSCHDGSIAVGSVLSRQQPIAMVGGITTLPPGGSNLGTDLSDDHPISFRYDQTLAARDLKIKPPTSLPPETKLDALGEMQCTSCHDAHDDRNGAFLVMDNRNSQLCNACHQVAQQTTTPAHVDCESCHQQHTAPSGALLLRGINANDTCGKCHGGQSGPNRGEDVISDLNKLSRHGNPNPAAVAAPKVRMRIADVDPQAVTCSGCHDAHTMQSGVVVAPSVAPQLGAVAGVNAAGGDLVRAQFGYEVCFKCHADRNVTPPKISRQIVQTSTRIQFLPTSVSFHPIEVSGKGIDVPSLRPDLNRTSIIACEDCHSSDSGRTAGGSGPSGPHGSNVAPLLLAGYETTDGTSESATAYALCYKCHQRTSILGDQSFSAHHLHIVDQRTPCSVCHDAHGISSSQGTTITNSHLINFDISVVAADPVSGQILYRSTGPRSGECFLTCHGVPHSPKSYPVIFQPPQTPGAPGFIGPVPPGVGAQPATQPSRLMRIQRGVQRPPVVTPQPSKPTPGGIR